MGSIIRVHVGLSRLANLGMFLVLSPRLSRLLRVAPWWPLLLLLGLVPSFVRVALLWPLSLLTSVVPGNFVSPRPALALFPIL